MQRFFLLKVVEMGIFPVQFLTKQSKFPLSFI